MTVSSRTTSALIVSNLGIGGETRSVVSPTQPTVRPFLRVRVIALRKGRAKAKAREKGPLTANRVQTRAAPSPQTLTSIPLPKRTTVRKGKGKGKGKFFRRFGGKGFNKGFGGKGAGKGKAKGPFRSGFRSFYALDWDESYAEMPGADEPAEHAGENTPADAEAILESWYGVMETLDSYAFAVEVDQGGDAGQAPAAPAAPPAGQADEPMPAAVSTEQKQDPPQSPFGVQPTQSSSWADMSSSEEMPQANASGQEPPMPEAPEQPGNSPALPDFPILPNRAVSQAEFQAILATIIQRRDAFACGKDECDCCNGWKSWADALRQLQAHDDKHGSELETARLLVEDAAPAPRQPGPSPLRLKGVPRRRHGKAASQSV